MVVLDKKRSVRTHRRRGVGLLACLTVALLMLSAGGYGAARTQEQRISLDLKNASVVDALREINRRSGNQVMFRNEEVEKEAARIDADLTDVTVADAVAHALERTGLTHVVRGDVLVVVPARGQTARQQDGRHVFNGTVLDADGNPLAGATVAVAGTASGTTTDTWGRFSFTGTSARTRVEISFVGYKTLTTTLSADTPATVSLEAESIQTGEVVVTGYQTIRRDRMTGSAVSVTAAQLENKGFASLEQVLNGTVAGLDMSQTGRPGQDARIMIRGANSLTGSTEPMWIVDGMPMQGEMPSIGNSTDLRATLFSTGIGNIAPSDIKSITVLKDAAATAIYGARAANGVIVIETKSGLEGRTRFSLSSNFGVTSRPHNNVKMMSTADKIAFERQILNDQMGYIVNPGRVTALMQQLTYQEITQAQADAEIAKLAAVETDWFREIFRPAFQQQHNFSMSGGDAKTQYYSSLNLLDQKGIEPNNAYDRLGMNIKLTHSPTKRLHIMGGVAGTMRNDRASASEINALEYAMFANPYEKPYNADGTYAWDRSWDPAASTLHDGIQWNTLNALDDMKRNTRTERYLDLQLNLKIEWEIARGLMFSTNGTYNANSNHTRTVEGEDTYTNFKRNWLNNYMNEVPRDRVKGALDEGTAYSTAYTWRNTLQYTREFDGKHFLTLFGGQEIWQRTGYTSSNYSPVFDGAHRVIGFPEMAGIDGSIINFAALGSSGKKQEKMSSFFANASYSYMDKYIITGAVRYDGSDIIGNRNQFTPLWNVGARWNVERERFMERIGWVDRMALRAGFGYTGSIDKNALPFLTMNLGQSVEWDGQTVPTSFVYPNYNVKWQTKQDFNVGLDLSLFGYAVDLGVNYYYNITRDVLDNRSLPWSSGRGVIKANVADIYNNGVEVDLGFTPVRSERLQWYTRFNVALNNNRIGNTFYKSIDELPDTQFNPSNASMSGKYFVEDYPVGGWFGYRYAGIDPMTGSVLVYTGNGEATYAIGSWGTEWAAPQVYYLGKSLPPVTGGFSTTVNWKQFVMSANFEFKAGHRIPSFNTFRRLDSRNRHAGDIDRWRQPGDQSNVPMLSEVFSAYANYLYDNRLESGDYLRCSYLNLGYNISPEVLAAIGFETARVSFTANNLFTLSKYRGIDPSLMGQFGYPNSRSYVLTLNLGF